MADTPSRASSTIAPEPSPDRSPAQSATNVAIHKTLSHHDPNRADLSFPFQSTNTEQGGFTEEYRTVTKEGYIQGNLALRPIPSHTSDTPPALRDPEKARALSDKKLVTFVPDDPDDPRNLPNWFKWCTSPR